jgi:hypothetical protein
MQLALIHNGVVYAEASEADAALGVFDIRDVSKVPGIAIGWLANADGTFTAPPAPPAPTAPTLDHLRAQIVTAASAACDSISGYIVPDATHQNAYTNAAIIVWANGGNAPSADPVKSVFSAQGASVGISDPDTFAKVVVAVSLSSMELATILATLKGAADVAQTANDLSASLQEFENSISSFVDSINSSGLTVKVEKPFAITIPASDA